MHEGVSVLIEHVPAFAISVINAGSCTFLTINWYNNSHALSFFLGLVEAKQMNINWLIPNSGKIKNGLI